MTRRQRRAALLTALLVLGVARDAHADPAPAPAPACGTTVVVPGAGEIGWCRPLHFKASPTITSAGGRVLTAPPGYYVIDETFAKLDAELRRAQDAETRLAAQNRSLRASASARPPVLALATALVVGIGIGVYASTR